MIEVSRKGIPGKRSLSRLWQKMLFCSVIATVSMPLQAQDSALPPDHGFMLIRLVLSARESVNTLAMTNMDTEHEAVLSQASFDPAGVNAWMALMAVPEGRYYMSEYAPSFGLGNQAANNLNTRHKRSEPGKKSETFQIVAGVVNYVGDWEMRVDTGGKNELDPTIAFDKTTLERYVSDYPEYMSKYKLYLSPMGQDAVSLDDLVKSQ